MKSTAKALQFETLPFNLVDSHRSLLCQLGSFVPPKFISSPFAVYVPTRLSLLSPLRCRRYRRGPVPRLFTSAGAGVISPFFAESFFERYTTMWFDSIVGPRRKILTISSVLARGVGEIGSRYLATEFELCLYDDRRDAGPFPVFPSVNCGVVLFK